MYCIFAVAKCALLQSPENGNVDFTDSVATYTCNNGYTLVGLEERLCNNDTAQWMGQEPECISELNFSKNYLDQDFFYLQF